MGPFLFGLGVVGILMIVGIGVNLYLYNQGAIGRRRLRRSQHIRSLAVESGIDEATTYATAKEDETDATAHYARHGILILLVCLVVIIMLIAVFLNALH